MKIKDELFKYFLQAGQVVKYQPSDIIYMQEDDASTIYLVLKGRVRVYQMTSKGEEITLEVLGRGRLFGESSILQDYLRPTTVEAVNNVELVSCRFDDLYPFLMDSKELTVSLLQTMTQTCDYITGLLKRAYSYNRYEKVAIFLTDQLKHDYNNGIIDNTIPYSHQEIADSVGLVRVTVTKVLREFAKKGYIENKYRKIKVLDKEALENIINE